MKEKDIYQFSENIFKNMGKDGALLTAGNHDTYNTMTIGWATIGVIWGKNVLTCYVRKSRFTYQFMEENDLFTVSFYDNQYKDCLTYLGSRSGRNEDKVKATNMTPLYVEDTVTFQEARVTFVCKKLYYQDLDSTKINEVIQGRYYPRGDFHRFYIGEIVKIIEKE
ncbi:MAG: flavin reductase [Bacilli bacterium]|nr:flavin reductase [Bacilli bacterium]